MSGSFVLGVLAGVVGVMVVGWCIWQYIAYRWWTES